MFPFSNFRIIPVQYFQVYLLLYEPYNLEQTLLIITIYFVLDTTIFFQFYIVNIVKQTRFNEGNAISFPSRAPRTIQV